MRPGFRRRAVLLGLNTSWRRGCHCRLYGSGELTTGCVPLPLGECSKPWTANGLVGGPRRALEDGRCGRRYGVYARLRIHARAAAGWLGTSGSSGRATHKRSAAADVRVVRYDVKPTRFEDPSGADDRVVTDSFDDQLERARSAESSVCACRSVGGTGIRRDRAAILGRWVDQTRDLRLEIAFAAWSSLPHDLTATVSACVTPVGELLRSRADQTRAPYTMERRPESSAVSVGRTSCGADRRARRRLARCVRGCRCRGHALCACADAVARVSSTGPSARAAQARQSAAAIRIHVADAEPVGLAVRVGHRRAAADRYRDHRPTAEQRSPECVLHFSSACSDPTRVCPT